MTTYTMRTVNELMDTLIKSGYEMLEVEEGTLGYGETIMVAPDTDVNGISETKYHFVIRERYQNAWSSAHTIRRASKLSKKQLAAWQAAYHEWYD